VVPGVQLEPAARIHRAVHHVIREAIVLACHDLSEGGLGVALAEMAFAGEAGAEVWLDKRAAPGCDGDDVLLFSESTRDTSSRSVPSGSTRCSPHSRACLRPSWRDRSVQDLANPRRERAPRRREALEDLKKSWKARSISEVGMNGPTEDSRPASSC
jgi:hypothetical protein